MSPILMQTQVPVISNEQCKKNYKKLAGYEVDPSFDDKIICTGLKRGGKDSCQGDSGGPVMLPIHRDGSFPVYQIGIVSILLRCLFFVIFRQIFDDN